MRYVGKDFPLQDPLETSQLMIDFTRHPEWKRWDYITNVTVTDPVVDGTDAAYATRIAQAPVICWPGYVTQPFANPVNGTKYKLTMVATTFGGQTLGLYANVTGQA